MKFGKVVYMLKMRKVLVVCFFLIGAAIAYTPIASAVFAFKISRALQALADGEGASQLAVTQNPIHRTQAGSDLSAVIYYPAGPLPTRALILTAGVSELGIYHPQLVALSRYLAHSGFLVLTPDVKLFRQFVISPEPISEIAFWHGQLRLLEPAKRVRSIGLAGISFSGTLALMAATRREVQPAPAFVLAIGPYFDLLRCTEGWFAAGPRTVSPGYYPTRYYARWIIMLAALDLLPTADDRSYLRIILTNLLMQKEFPLPDVTPSTEARRWERLAVMPEDESDHELAKRIERHLSPSPYQPLNPGPILAQVRCPVFLLHGSSDDLIAPDQSLSLRNSLINAESYLLISPFLTHTHASQKSLSSGQKLKAIIEMAGFLYHLSAAAR